MKKIILACCVFMFSIVGYSQSDYRKGYVVTMNMDTIHGFINFRGKSFNAQSCHFKKERTSRVIVYTPDQIRSYKFNNGKYYIARELQLNYEKKKVFVEFLVDGLVDLFYYTNFVHDEYYLVENNEGELYKLTNDDKNIYKGSQHYQKSSNKYKGVLKYLFRDAEKTRKDVDHVLLNRKSLVKISKKYHNEVCVPGDVCIDYTETKTQATYSFGLLFGVASTSLSEIKSDENPYVYLEDSDFKSSAYSSFGFYYKRSLPNWNEKMFFESRVMYASFKQSTTNDHSNVNSSPIRDVYQVDAEVSSLGLDLLLKYEFNKSLIKPNVHFGIFGDYYVSKDYKATRTSTFFNSGNLKDRYTYQNTEDIFDAYNAGVILGLGVRNNSLNKQEISLDFTYKFGLGYSNYFNTHTISLNLAYGFIK
ncbi:hypothetical protein [Ochrovirga pacifica]|uniref:hypothetical protein n=1 Tax=Ochrovirga pacifica TaxID=1042376 RepID=UPI0002558EDA|nr:hypothetical protein [Ochrovirga pacifica]